jgi:hypothetical protein
MAENPDSTDSTAAVRGVNKAPADTETVNNADDVAGHVQPPPDFDSRNTER